MFLITTPIEESWKEEEILFLGEWCKAFNRKHIWDKLTYQTLPYHWDNSNKFLNDNILLESIYEKYLLILSDELNKIHNTDHSIRYWRIIIGLWLRYFLDILYDRYKSIINSNKLFTIHDTWILKYNFSNWVPLNYQDFHLASFDDKWNHIIYSEVIKNINSIPFSNVDIELKSDRKDINSSSLFKSFMSKAIIEYNKHIPEKYKKIFFVNTIWPKKEVLSLQLATNQFPNLFETLVSPVKIKRKKYNSALRAKCNINYAENQFEKIIDRLIPIFMPTSYLESYKNIMSKAMEVYPLEAKIIYTSNAYSYDEGFKVWSATQVEKGAKLIIGQHGGRTGTAKIHQADKHQIKICDNYISWGWKKDKVKNITPLPSIKLSKIKISPIPDGKVLVFLPSYQKYFYHSCSMLLAGQNIEHFENQLLVLKYLPTHISKNYNFRLAPREDALHIELRLKDRGLGDLIGNRDKSFIDSANESRLIIHSDNSTSLLETMASNYPSLIYWNPEYYELTDEAKPYFEAFYNLGIMHYKPESVAKKLNEIYFDTISWWNQPDIQNIREEFSRKYALSSDNCLEPWKKYFIFLNKF